MSEFPLDLQVAMRPHCGLSWAGRDEDASFGLVALRADIACSTIIYKNQYSTHYVGYLYSTHISTLIRQRHLLAAALHATRSGEVF